MTDYLACYLAWVLNEIKHAEMTHTTYQSWLRRYARWLGDNGFPDVGEALSLTNLRPYLYSLSKQGLASNQARLFTENPLRGLTMPKKARAAVRP